MIKGMLEINPEVDENHQLVRSEARHDMAVQDRQLSGLVRKVFTRNQLISVCSPGIRQYLKVGAAAGQMRVVPVLL